MSEEEIIENVNELISWKGKNVEIRDYEIESIQGLLDLYNQTKKKLTEYENQMDLDYVDENYVSKEKIREKIKEYYEYDKRMQNKPDWHTIKYYKAKALEELLEEKINA